ncbi:MAG: hypothetical protein OEW15_12725 [Nitrospirota bacterium]|nr:hypothetical protein [Nitrospirota bacterium]
MKKGFVVLVAILLLCSALPAYAKTEITLPGAYTQEQFKDLSRDLGLAISYVPLATAEPLGGVLPGLDLGIEVTGVQIDTKKVYWQTVEAVSGDKIPTTLPFPKLHLQVGLPVVPIDLGVVYSAVPGTNIKYMGGELKYSIFKGGVVWPALAVRGAYTKLSGVEDLDINTKSVDLSISKGILMFTPYAGYGRVWITSKENTNLPLQEEKISENKAFVGCKFTFFPLMNLVVEADFAEVNSYSARLNLHF